jgi:hypothetical protein
MAVGTSLASAALAFEEAHTPASCFVKPLVEPWAGSLASTELAFGVLARIVTLAALDKIVAGARPAATALVATTSRLERSSGALDPALKVLDR